MGKLFNAAGHLSHVSLREMRRKYAFQLGDEKNPQKRADLEEAIREIDQRLGTPEICSFPGCAAPSAKVDHGRLFCADPRHCYYSAGPEIAS
jgi:hypothetical protein